MQSFGKRFVLSVLSVLAFLPSVRADDNPFVMTMLEDYNPSTDGSSPHFITKAGDKLFFKALARDTCVNLWVSDGTAEGTHILRDGPLVHGSCAFSYSIGQQGISIGSVLYYEGGSQAHGVELWRSDGTLERWKSVV